MQYEYKCNKCGKITLINTDDYELKTIICKYCKGKARRIISLSSFRWRYNDK
jgi:putative FmdB family regulatory protein